MGNVVGADFILSWPKPLNFFLSDFAAIWTDCRRSLPRRANPSRRDRMRWPSGSPSSSMVVARHTHGLRQALILNRRLQTMPSSNCATISRWICCHGVWLLG